MSVFTFEIFSLTQKEVSFKNTKSVTAMTSEGEISIYDKHMPLVTDVLPGKIKIRENGNTHEYEHDGGILVTEKSICQFFKTQKEDPIVFSKQTKKLSAEEITRQMINEFVGRLSKKEGMASS